MIWRREIAGEFPENLLIVGVKKNADVMAEDCSFSDDGSCFTLKTPSGSCEIRTHLLGIHNIYNLILATVVVKPATTITLITLNKKLYGAHV